jgi:hypothetical protein
MMGQSTSASYIRIGGSLAVLALIEGSSLPAGAAEPLSGWYISGVAGLNITQEEAIKNVGPVTTNNLTRNSTWAAWACWAAVMASATRQS